MVDALKKLDKKFLIVAGAIVGLPILLIIFLSVLKSCNTGDSYEKYERKMKSAAEKYLTETKKLPNAENKIVTVDLSKLVNKEYIKDTDKALNNDTCKGFVTARFNSPKTEVEGSNYISYTASLECKDYKTNSLINLALGDLTTSGDGLYEINGEYVFRGKHVNNYVTFFDKNYRLLSIDSNGIAKLLKIDSENLDVAWDLKYNINTKREDGISIYKDSNVLEKLYVYYNNPKKVSEETKKHIVTKDICIGHRAISNVSIYDENDCLSVLEGQPISLINITDFAKASLDENCTTITSNSCRNYNYLKSLNMWTWTVNGVSDNTHEVYFLGNGKVDHMEASRIESYNIIIYIDASDIVSSGTGSNKTPYVIK